MRKLVGYKIVRSNGANDCSECVFALSCIEICGLAPGFHYEKVKK